MTESRLGFPIAKLTHLPTPLEEAPRFAKVLGGPRVFIKRDDTTGLALGGNKARKLEFLLGEALSLGCDSVVTCGGPQSNHARMTAAAARKYGLEPVLVLEGDDPGHRMGNLLLDTLLDAELVFAGDKPADIVMEEVRERLLLEGKKPYMVPLGGSSPLGTLGYIACAEEIVRDCDAVGIRPKALYLAAGSLGTLAGVLLGKFMYDAPSDVLGVAVGRTSDSTIERGVNLTLEAKDLVLQSQTDKPVARALSQVTAETVRPLIRILTDQVGQGYGIPTPECLEAITLLARTEGILTDPVYTGKALAAMVAAIRGGQYGKDDAVIFLHTGGVPADFAYGDAFLTKEEPR